MNTLETIWFVTCAALGWAGAISMQQARYYDGDPNAHASSDDFPIFHIPRHPHAIRAKRRGWILIGLAAGLTVTGFTVRAVA